MFFARLLVLLALYTLPTLSLPQPAPPSAASTNFTITSFNYGGSGCPQNSVVGTFNVDNSGVSLSYSSYSLEVGPAVGVGNVQKACTINVGISAPGGYAVALTTVDNFGFRQLDAKVKADLTFKYRWQGVPTQPTAVRTLVGPAEGDYTYRDQFDGRSFSPCRQNVVLTLESSIALSNAQNRTGGGFITRDITSLTLSQKMGLKVVKC